jgi:hypothetical protein
MSEPQLANGADASLPRPSAHTASKPGGEIRLSFRFFYVVLKWGHEKRSATRIDDDRRAFPVLTATHAPVLIGIWAALFMLAYAGLKAGITGLVYLFAS